MDTLIEREPLELEDRTPWTYGAEELNGLAPEVRARFSVRVEKRHRVFTDLLVITYVQTAADAAELARMSRAMGWAVSLPGQKSEARA